MAVSLLLSKILLSVPWQELGSPGVEVWVVADLTQVDQAHEDLQSTLQNAGHLARLHISANKKQTLHSTIFMFNNDYICWNFYQVNVIICD